MNQITIDKNILLVEVSEDANGFDASDKWECFAYYEGEPSFESMRMINISPGNWQFIGTTDAITEEIAAKIVEQFNNPFWKNMHGKFYDYSDESRTHTVSDKVVDTALESYQSWLRAKKIPSDKRFAILKLNP